MAASPSPKRRRQGDSPFDIVDDSVIDPSLMPAEDVTQPTDSKEQQQPVENDPAKDDPTYQLFVERAYADQRFKATMNHIFEKYGRDFDGVGDEIDLETGEIVVNNGHIQNMRNEADIGDGTTEPAEGDEETGQGTYLGDLTDGSEDGEGTAAEESADTQPTDATSNQQPFNLGMNMYDPRFTAMLPALYAGAQVAFGWGIPPGMPTNMPSAATPGMPPGMLPGMPPGMTPGGPPTMPQGMDPQQAMFMPPPMPWGPWSMPTEYPMPPWMQHFQQMQQWQQMQQAPPNPPLDKPVKRYDFPAQSGRTSVWAKNSRFKDDSGARQARIGSKPSVLGSKARTKSVRPGGSLLGTTMAASATQLAGGEVEDDADDEELLALEESRRFRALPPRSGEEEDSELFWEDEPVAKPKEEPPKKRGRGRPKGSKSKHNLAKLQDGELPPTKSKIEMKRRERMALKEKLLAQHYEKNPEPEPLQSDDVEGRRRSGRDRKLADDSKEMLSWDRVKAERRAEYKAMMKIRADRKITKRERASSRDSRQGTESFETWANETSTTGEQVQDAEAQEPASTIPDSQESAALQSITGSQKLNTSPKSPEKKASKQLPAQIPVQNSAPPSDQPSFDALMALSDDEAPAVVTKRKVVRKQKPALDEATVSNPVDSTTELATEKQQDNDMREATNPMTSNTLHSTCPDSTDVPLDRPRREPVDDYSNLLDIFPSSSPIMERHIMPLSPDRVFLDPSPPKSERSPDHKSSQTIEPQKAPASQPNTGTLDEPSLFISNDDDTAAVEQPENDTAKKASRSISGSQPISSPNGKASVSSSQQSASKATPSSRRQTPEKARTETLEHQDVIDSESILVDESVNIAAAKELAIRSPKPPSVSLTATDYSVPKVTLKRPASSSTASRPSSSSKRKAPRVSSKRHSLLSLVGDDDVDDLDRNPGTSSKPSTSKPKPSHKVRKPSLITKDSSRSSSVPKEKSKTTDASLTKKAKRNKPVSSVSTAGTCGVDGYACGQDFCFTCL